MPTDSMNRTRPAPRLPLALSLLALAATAAVHAQPASPDDWPCVQVFVPEIAPVTFWPVPIDAAVLGTWRDDPDVRALAVRLGELERVDEATLAAIDAYADGVPEERREAALSRLADGTVSVADERRALYLDGIRRYTRQQIAIAGQIESTLNRLAELDDARAAGEDAAASAVPAAERVEIEETLAWHERLYDQRERAIRALCERPVELEETLSEVLREMSYRLPGA